MQTRFIETYRVFSISESWVKKRAFMAFIVGLAGYHYGWRLVTNNRVGPITVETQITCIHGVVRY